jgi:hypothetical protein
MSRQALTISECAVIIMHEIQCYERQLRVKGNSDKREMTLLKTLRQSASRILTVGTIVFLCLTPLLLAAHTLHQDSDGDNCALCLVAQHFGADVLQPALQVHLSIAPVSYLVEMETLLLTSLLDVDYPIRAPPSSPI